jgi:hypothetical protein
MYENESRIKVIYRDNHNRRPAANGHLSLLP